MKRIIALVLVCVLLLAGCAGGKSKAMTHEQYVAAEMQSQVVVETYVQAHQSWWDNKVTVYCQSPDGAYFLWAASPPWHEPRRSRRSPPPGTPGRGCGRSC